MNNLTIRLETEKDYRAVEELTREAFWNVYKPGADEHYFVHTMRSHPDFIPELAFVLELDGKIVGNIMYTKAWLEDENGKRKEILSFGPLCVAPEYQRQKFGKMLIKLARNMSRKGHDAYINALESFDKTQNIVQGSKDYSALSLQFFRVLEIEYCEKFIVPLAEAVREDTWPYKHEGLCRRWLYRHELQSP